MKFKLIASILALSAATLAGAVEPSTVNLWPDGNPNDNGRPDDRVAEMTIYRPDKDKDSGIAVAILPGGAYAGLAIGHEGHDIGRWYAENGITAGVVRYRLPNGHPEVPESDAREAVRRLRAMGAVKTGIQGSSAGGHLATTVSTHEADSLSHPDFTILFYPVVTSDSRYTHHDSMHNLLGDRARDWYALREYSNELRVNGATPPALIFYSDDDNGVAPENGALYYQALKNNGIKAGFHVFPTGGHGWGFNDSFPYKPMVQQLILDWIHRL